MKKKELLMGRLAVRGRAGRLRVGGRVEGLWVRGGQSGCAQQVNNPPVHQPINLGKIREGNANKNQLRYRYRIQFCYQIPEQPNSSSYLLSAAINAPQ
ncbi:hypothetical protein BVRB_8g201660 [Beta vulgaris subsp. vulgaris]|uniref:Uncharacterized protein n=1 Tax=Beta vulgaris subsp. vulgaris TaxID=3555 RepID=A0A0J8B6I1_BETVV|nr:hypothetical protein BVRB_8g201660 [Beta vulgaris subsp. vulgaris]